MRKLLCIIIFLLCTYTTASAAVYGSSYNSAYSSSYRSSYCSAYKPPANRGVYSTAEAAINATVKRPRVAFSSTSPNYMLTATRTNVRGLNTDGIAPIPYTTPNIPQPCSGGGLDIDDEDEPIGGMVPVGDVPFGFFLIVLALFLVKIRFRARDRLPLNKTAPPISGQYCKGITFL